MTRLGQSETFIQPQPGNKEPPGAACSMGAGLFEYRVFSSWRGPPESDQLLRGFGAADSGGRPSRGTAGRRLACCDETHDLAALDPIVAEEEQPPQGVDSWAFGCRLVLVPEPMGLRAMRFGAITLPQMHRGSRHPRQAPAL